jgi:beta-galactosidase
MGGGEVRRKYLSRIKFHVIAAACIVGFAIFHTAPARTVQNMNANWKFYKGDATGAQSTTFSDASWQTVQVPHPFEYLDYHVPTYYQGIGWYRKTFSLDATAAGKKVFLRFEGAMTVAQVYVNGTLITTHYGGFTPFTIDITANVTAGSANNLLAVRLDNTWQNLVPPQKTNDATIDYLLFGGLYRDVTLLVVDPLHVPDACAYVPDAVADSGGVFVTTPSVSASTATVRVKTIVKNEFAAAKTCVLQTTILDGSGASVGTAQTTQSIAANGTFAFLQNFTVATPSLWSPVNPALYRAITEVYDNTTLVDTVITRFGIRSISFVKQTGFFLNGTSVKLLGVNRHQLFPYLGHALPDRAQYRDAKILKDMGCNFVRLSHYPMSPSFMDGCDELGIMVEEEAPSWQGVNQPDLWYLRHNLDVRSMIRRDRNRPCVVVWGVGPNESQPEAAREQAEQATAKAEDTTRPTTMARPYSTTSNVFDVYFENVFTPPLPASPVDQNTIGYFNSEHTGHTYPKARWDPEADLIEHAHRHELMTTEARTKAWVAGGNGWCAFDYNTYFNSYENVAYHGVADIFRIPKFTYYFYQSQCAGDNYVGSRHPMVFIESFNEGYAMPGTQTFKIFSNCDQVELFVNGTSVGTQSPDAGTSLAHPPFTFANVSYSSPGTLRADGKIGGVVVATQTLNRAGTKSKILLNSDTDTLFADGTDIARIVVTVADNNNRWSHADVSTVVAVSASGAGKVICGSAGPVASGSVTVEDGRLAFLVQAGLAAGTITVTATSGTLTQAQKTIVVIAPPTTGVKESGSRFIIRKITLVPAIRCEGKSIVFENLDRSTASQITVVSLNGRIVKRMNVAGNDHAIMQTGNFSEGIYTAVVKCGPQIVRKNVLLLK